MPKVVDNSFLEVFIELIIISKLSIAYISRSLSSLVSVGYSKKKYSIVLVPNL